MRFATDRTSLDALLISPELGNRAQFVKVQIPAPNEPELLRIMAQKGVAVSVAGPDASANLAGVIANLAFPLLLLGGLFLLSRRAQGGMGGGGQPGFGLGKTKARFEMEPNTGVTFKDVAGVDEAKQDLVEVVPPSPCSRQPVRVSSNQTRPCPAGSHGCCWLRMIFSHGEYVSAPGTCRAR